MLPFARETRPSLFAQALCAGLGINDTAFGEHRCWPATAPAWKGLKKIISASAPAHLRPVLFQAVYTLARSNDEAVMSAGMKALHNVLLRAQHLEGVDHIFSNTVRDKFWRPGTQTHVSTAAAASTVSACMHTSYEAQQ